MPISIVEHVIPSQIVLLFKLKLAHRGQNKMYSYRGHVLTITPVVGVMKPNPHFVIGHAKLWMEGPSQLI